ncbi:transmembrane 7 superfamily member 3 isoform X1 [Manduca sexta]|uniref:transmembrane 7 superfamily member 3 isoform X1 n=1 Tax=Manduca sexta TaxID=7130 RepID=UPI001183BDA8|nr:transmembrane 7 superfamily member 3 isoform X1 [Manduca sexta]
MFSVMKLFTMILFIFSASSEISYVVNYTNGTTFQEGQVLTLSSSSDYYDVNITIPLSKPTYMNKEISSDFIFLATTMIIKVTLVDIDPELSFLIAQVHAKIDKVEIYKSFKKTRVIGQNVGLYFDAKNEKHVFYILNRNCEGGLFYVSVHGYGPKDPIPGGCNLESKIPIPPSTDIRLSNNYYNVEIAPPMAPYDPNCLENDVFITFYMLYQSELDYTTEVYFDGIRRMINYENITKNGIVVPFIFWNTRRMMSRYHGTNAVFAAVASTADGYSIYVPAQTYGCVNTSDQFCVYLGDIRTIIFVLFLMAISFLICFGGHRYVHIEMFSQGLMTSTFVCFVIMTATTSESYDIKLLISFIFGLVFASVWSMAWLVWRSPITIMLIPAFNCGFLVAGIMYYVVPSSMIYLGVDFNFWSLFFLVLLLVAMVILSTSKFGNILSCAFFGSYGFVVAGDMLLGSNFKYIVVNVLRRATVPNFNKAVLFPPFQTGEKVMIAVWVLIALAGMAVQYWFTRGQTSFPMCAPQLTMREAVNVAMYGTVERRIAPRTGGARNQSADEHTPLLA